MASLSGCMIGWIFCEIDIINPDENCWDGRRLWCADTSLAMAINILVLRSATPVVPVTVHGTEKLMPKGSSVVSSGPMALVFHPPIATKDLDDSDRQELVAQVRKTMEATLQGPSPLDPV